MAKMRGIKPETFTDDKVLQLSPLARWLFVGLWTVACDNGHVEDNLVQIKVRLLPVDDCSVGGLLEELLATQQVTREGGYLKVVNLAEHQNIDKRYLRLCEWCKTDPDVVFTEADRPARPSRAHRAEGSTDTVAHRATTVGTPGAQRGHTVEGEGEGEGEGEKRASRRKSPSRTIPEDWKPTTQHAQQAAEKGVDLSSEAFRFRNHAISVDRRLVNWNAGFTNWLANAKPDQRTAPTRGQQPEGW